jgi:hypothetical protein
VANMQGPLNHVRATAGAIAQAGVVLLVETVVRKTDLDAAVSAPWRKARAVQIRALLGLPCTSP